jgi:uncharacterized protein YjbJ (UPF0337 family)
MDSMKNGSQTKWEGRWDQLKGHVKHLWGSITDNDLKKVEGNYDKTIGLIKERTGKKQEEIEKMLDEHCTKCS